MAGQGAMTGFAIDVGMAAMTLCVRDIRVALLASLVASELDGPSGDFVDGRCAVMAVQSEGLRDYKAANAKKDEEGENEKSGKPEEVPCILEEVHPAAPRDAEVLDGRTCELEHSAGSQYGPDVYLCM
jgi:hypothetical protein